MSDIPDIKEYKGGLIVEEIKPEDWVFGALDRPQINITGDWRKYKGNPDRQATKYFDPFSCVSVSETNQEEELLNWMMEQDPTIKPILEMLQCLDDDGKAHLSGRYLAVASGTIPGVGNSQSKVLETRRKKGFVGEKVWPTNQDMTEAEYFNLDKNGNAQIPQNVLDMAAKSLQFFDFAYETIINGMIPTNVQIKDATTKGPLTVLVGGTYIGSEGDANPDDIGSTLYHNVSNPVNYNHSVNYVNQEENVHDFSDVIPVVHDIYDSYDPFDKRFYPNYPFGYPRIIYLSKKKSVKYKIFGKSAIFLLDPVSKRLVPYGSGKVYKTIEGTQDYQGIVEVPTKEALLKIAPLADWMIISADWDSEAFLNS